MAIMLGHIAAGKHGAGASPKNIHVETDELTGNAMSFWNLKAYPNDTPAPARPHLRILPKHSTKWRQNIRKSLWRLLSFKPLRKKCYKMLSSDQPAAALLNSLWQWQAREDLHKTGSISIPSKEEEMCIGSHTVQGWGVLQTVRGWQWRRSLIPQKYNTDTLPHLSK